MTKKYIFLSLVTALLFGSIHSLQAQTNVGPLTIVKQEVQQVNNQLKVDLQLVLDSIHLRSNDMLILTPVIKSNTSKDELRLSPVVIMGSKRSTLIQRKHTLGYTDIFDQEPLAVVKRNAKTSQSIPYKQSILFRAWMEEASLHIEKTLSGCADCQEELQQELLAAHILPTKQLDAYQISFIVPEVEPVKARSDRHTATFNYVVDRYELLRNFKNNAQQFAEVDQIVGDIQRNSDLQITEFSIVGYASPEASFEHNRQLANNRAQSFADYLMNRFGIERKQFTMKGGGEDWVGLRKAVASSNLDNKAAILQIIDQVSNPDARDAELKKLSDGATYKTLLEEFYPPLRRTEYSVAYIVRAFNLEEARQLIHTNPRLLSLNEMYLVAQSYSVESAEFREVFDIAVRMYPDSDIAIINSAAADLENKLYDSAIKRLSKIENKAISWNNLGLAYILKGEIDKAKQYWEKAAKEGDSKAKANLIALENNLSK